MRPLLFRCTRMIPVVLLCAAGAHADDFRDFRIPDNGYLQWNMGGDNTARWSQSHREDVRSESGAYTGDLFSQFHSVRDGDSRTSLFDLAATLIGDRTHDAYRTHQPYGWWAPDPTRLYTDDASRQRVSESLKFYTQQRWYPETAPLFLSVDAEASLRDAQSWDSGQSGTRDPGYTATNWTASSRKTYSSTSSFGPGVGCGRVRNATGIYEARILEARLRTAGAIVRPLSTKARQRLASLMYAVSDYEAALDRPAAAVWSDLESILREDGALEGRTIDLGTLFHLTDPFLARDYTYFRMSLLPRSPVVRLSGWAILFSGAGRWSHTGNHFEASRSMYSHADSFPPNYSESHYRSVGTSSGNSFDIRVAAELHRPLGMRAQFDATADYVHPTLKESQGFATSLQASLQWIVADRWIASASLAHFRVLQRDRADRTLDDEWNVSAGAAVAYAIVDHIWAHASLSQIWQGISYDPYRFQAVSFGEDHGSSGTLHLGLTYRIAGYVDTPELPAAN